MARPRKQPETATEPDDEHNFPRWVYFQDGKPGYIVYDREGLKHALLSGLEAFPKGFVGST